MMLFDVKTLPSAETLTYLSRVFTSSSLPFDLDNLSVSINISESEVPEEKLNATNALFTAKAAKLDIWYEPMLNTSQLILLLQSESLTDRALQLRQYAPNSIHKTYYPHIVLLEYMPDLRRHYIAQINSYGDTFLRDDFTFTFEGEFTDAFTTERPPSLALYEALDMQFSQMYSRRTSY